MVGSGSGWHARSQFVDVDGVRAHYVEKGHRSVDRPSVLLIHGILVSSWSWRFNLDAISRNSHVLALCQKGHGWSHKGPGDYTLVEMAEFVRGFLEAKGIEKIDLVGHCLGGAVSLQFAIMYPNRVRRMVLVGAAAVPVRLGILLSLQQPQLDLAYKAAFRPTVFRVLLRTLAYRNFPIDDDYMDGFLKPLRLDGSIVSSVSVFRNLQAGLKQLFPRVREIEHPSLLIWGRHDRLVPLRSGLILNRLIASSQLEVFPECGHCPPEEEPARFNALIERFLGQPEKLVFRAQS